MVRNRVKNATDDDDIRSNTDNENKTTMTIMTTNEMNWWNRASEMMEGGMKKWSEVSVANWISRYGFIYKNMQFCLTRKMQDHI